MRTAPEHHQTEAAPRRAQSSRPAASSRPRRRRPSSRPARAEVPALYASTGPPSASRRVTSAKARRTGPPLGSTTSCCREGRGRLGGTAQRPPLGVRPPPLFTCIPGRCASGRRLENPPGAITHPITAQSPVNGASPPTLLDGLPTHPPTHSRRDSGSEERSMISTLRQRHELGDGWPRAALASPRSAARRLPVELLEGPTRPRRRLQGGAPRLRGIRLDSIGARLRPNGAKV